MRDGWLDDLRHYRLIDLTAFRRGGEPVATPVRYAIDGRRLIVSLQSHSGKVTRATADPVVRVAGHPGGQPREARLRFLEGAEATAARRQLRRRHRLLFLQRLATGRHPAKHRMAEIRFDTAGPPPAG